jgi:hypothetical protein
MAQVRHTTEEHLCSVQLYFRHESARKCHRKSQHKFPEPPQSRQNTYYLVSNLKTTGLLIRKNPDKKQNTLTENALDDIGGRLETSTRKSLKQVMQEISASRTTA